jgi:hypothetical protein
VLRWSRAILGSAVERPRAADSKPRAGREEETLRLCGGVDCRFKAMRCAAGLANHAMLRQGVEARAGRRPRPGGGTASYSNRILRGDKPGGLSVQAPTKYETVINLKTAMALSLAVPAAMLAAADKAIRITTMPLHMAEGNLILPTFALAEICSPRDFLRMDAKQISVASRRL